MLPYIAYMDPMGTISRRAFHQLYRCEALYGSQADAQQQGDATKPPHFLWAPASSKPLFLMFSYCSLLIYEYEIICHIMYEIPPTLRGAHLGGGTFHLGGGFNPFPPKISKTSVIMCQHLFFFTAAHCRFGKSVKSWHWHQTAGCWLYEHVRH